MCGIAGILRVYAPGQSPESLPPPRDSIPDAWLRVLDDGIAHRGPDGRGEFRDRAVRGDGCTVDVALIHRRLTVIDPRTGAQPMVTGEGRALLATVFNGCIYNHRDLRRELSALGRRFTTDHADTEVIPHAYAQWGDDAPAHLDGMFAFAVWDRVRAELFLARDTAGEKPLYECHAGPGVYAFASVHAALGRFLARFGQELGGNGLMCSPQGLAEWLRFGGSLIPLTNQIDEVDVRVCSRTVPGDDDGANPGGVSATRGWYADLPARRPTNDGKAVPTAADVDSCLAAAVQSRLEADVPLGCFLSGGVDSSLVALHARRALGSLRTFTVRMPDARYDESDHAARVAGLIGAEHHTLDCNANPAEDLVHLIEQLGLPFGDSSLLPTYWVSRAARQHVTVALSGDGGDELFAGYERHAAARWLARAPGFLGLLPNWIGAGAHPRSNRAKLARLGNAARHGYDELLAIFPHDMLRHLAPGLPELPPGSPRVPTLDAPRRDFEWYLPGDLLRKADTASMAVALEVRAPFLARSMVHLGLTTPLAALTPGGQRKGLLRAAARLHLPADVVDRPKMGFAIPLSEWLRSDFGGLGSLLRDTLAAADPFPASLLGVEIDRSFVSRLVDDHMTARRDHAQRLYMLLVLALWCRSVKGWGSHAG